MKTQDTAVAPSAIGPASREDAALTDFLISRGGPFLALQRQLGLLQERALASHRRAGLFVGLAWGVPLLLSLVEGRAFGPISARPYLLDPGVWARFFLAVAIFFLMERQVEERLRRVLRQFANAALIRPSQLPVAAEAVLRAIRRRDAPLAEAICLGFAILVTLAAVYHALHSDAASWLVTVTPEGRSFTLAGWWVIIISSPLFWFLLFRWLWRHLVWGFLLRDLARLNLRLIATHPDRLGGIGFVGRYPNAFASFVFALSGVLGAAVAKALLDGDIAIQSFSMVVSAWLILVVVLFAFPLAAFAPSLRRLKERTLALYSAGAGHQHRAAERQMFGYNVAGPGETEPSPPEGDPTKTYAAVLRLSTMPISKSVLLPLGAAAALPLMAAGATQMPLKDLLKILRGLLL